MALTVTNQSDINDDDLLKKVAPIISSVEVVPSSNNISVAENSVMGILEELVK